MSRTSTTAWDSQTTQNVTLAVPVVDVVQDYSILERDVQKGSTILSNIDSAPDLQEFITYKYSDASEITMNAKLKAINPPTTKDGYVFSIKDEWIQRTTETDGTTHDDPTSIWLTFKTTRGANYADGSNLLPLVVRLLGIVAPVIASSNSKNDPTYTLDSELLDRLLHGVTKPVSVS